MARSSGLGKADCKCVHATAWDDIYVDGGVLYVALRSGNKRYMVSMGPPMAVQLRERIRRALVRCDVLPAKQDGAH